VLGAVSDYVASAVPLSLVEPIAARALARAERRVSRCDDRELVDSCAGRLGCSAAAAVLTKSSRGPSVAPRSAADERNRIARVPVKFLGGCTGSSGTEATRAGAGESGAEDGCCGERVPPAEDVDADPAVTATPVTAATICAKARPDPKDRRPTPTRASLPKRSLSNNRLALIAPASSAVAAPRPCACPPEKPPHQRGSSPIQQPPQKNLGTQPRPPMILSAAKTIHNARATARMVQVEEVYSEGVNASER